MADPSATTQVWQIQYSSDPEIAAAMAAAFGEARIPVGPPVSTPVTARLGAPEVVLTIVATVALKAVVLAGLDALKQYLEQQSGKSDEHRIQVIVERPDASKKRFGLNLKNLSLDVISRFISEISEAVDHI